ncbi:alpha-2,3-sialyltransferase [Pelagibacterium xiamenense]|uniref:alpha-2,3-sialyltransferase n=1 Tax=Pelagibacterium xiamenense TaxID=2901140 RepID=UPI001E3AFB0E|nr:alpha-2,3-sialyltransferase [Pelagibacterium xiamenense]MCD7061402.1 hypothetical protein [Pelagibacterium xiamenense]
MQSRPERTAPWTPPSKRFVVAGSGPSLLALDPARIDAESTIVRVNNFFFEETYHLGRRADLVQVGGDRWIFPFYAATLKKLVAEGTYSVGAWSCHQRHVIARGQRALDLPFMPLGYRDAAAEKAITGLIEAHDKTPTTGILAIINAHALGAETITLAGIDLYAAPDRYAHRLEGHSAALVQQIGTAGYNLKFHDPELDLAILRYLADRADVELYRSAPEAVALDFLPLAPVSASGLKAEPKRDALNDWVGWAGLWPIGAMRLARRTNEFQRAVRKSLFKKGAP